MDQLHGVYQRFYLKEEHFDAEEFVHFTDDQGNTALHILCELGSKENIRKLLKQNALWQRNL